ncbi:MAG TPA: hypothetical protein VFR44_07610 [Actinomycetota bacterium]|nr:hypothetical protein [Actinomycetota bacterium]
MRMEFGRFAFGSIQVDGATFTHDVVIDRGRIRKRKKGPSKALRPRYGHTPLTPAEDIPWACRRLVVGTGAAGSLPVTDELVHEAERRRVELVTMPTAQAIEELRDASPDTNAILHVTC